MVHTNFRKAHTNGGYPALPARACPHAGGRAGSFGAARRQAPCGAALNLYTTFISISMLHTVSGKVVKGRGYGKKIGFPTINLDRREYKRLNLNIPEGIYAGVAKIKESGQIVKAGIVIGIKDKRGLPKIEAHLLGFTGVLYGKRIELSLRKYLRAFMSFRSERTLKAQIAVDMAMVEKAISLTN